MTLRTDLLWQWTSASKVRQLAMRVCQLLISLSLLAWLLSKVDSRTVGVIVGFPPATFAIALVVFASSQVFGALRLWVLLRGQEASFQPLHLMRLTFIGFFANNFLPSTVGGDVYRVVALTRGGHDLKLAILTLVADRFLNLIVIVLMTAAALPFTDFWNMRAGVTGTSLTSLAIWIAAVLAILAGLGALASRSPSFRPSVVRLSQKLAAAAERAFRFVSMPRALALAVLFSGLSAAASILAQFIIAKTLGMGVDLMQLTAVIGLVTLAALMPVSLNGIGLQEAGLVALSQLLGVAQEPAIAFAAFSRALILGTSFIGGILLMFSGQSATSQAHRPNP
ncbi:lysylphosphatidylglycerol synthase transmembrane domain-containing protein [Bradyrhizobium sp. AS23.2]|uniref:lysylphosphatidylglycerol synthase transmembrane domain-containing protein n=1 Tax=Bradyrhizobium sp. AS23.2 TaxID=1680155 RepID=UPI0014320AE5|nr:lysylphosphatidylglycerol synthase transmembrane domain-containing protein [Bradyrhizobium sp. AS23.2]